MPQKHVLAQKKALLAQTFDCRYCRQVLCETVRTAKLTPIAARLQELEGRIDQHIIPKEVGQSWELKFTLSSVVFVPFNSEVPITMEKRRTGPSYRQSQIISLAQVTPS